MWSQRTTRHWFNIIRHVRRERNNIVIRRRTRVNNGGVEKPSVPYRRPRLVLTPWTSPRCRVGIRVTCPACRIAFTRPPFGGYWRRKMVNAVGTKTWTTATNGGEKNERRERRATGLGRTTTILFGNRVFRVRRHSTKLLYTTTTRSL